MPLLTEESMSWFCQMVDGERRCMDFGAYIKHGWQLDKSFKEEDYAKKIQRQAKANGKPISS